MLVSDAHTLGALGVIRSLGRAGYKVHACSSEPDTLGFKSVFSLVRTVCPGYRESRFLDWLRSYLGGYDISVIVPSEPMLVAIRDVYDEFSHLLPYGSEGDIVFRGLSKYDVFSELSRGGVPISDASKHLPPSLLVERGGRLPEHSDFEALNRPLFLKADSTYSSVAAKRSTVLVADSAAEAREMLKRLLCDYHKVLVQGFVPGRGVGVFFLLWDGRIIAEFGRQRLHEVPLAEYLLCAKVGSRRK